MNVKVKLLKENAKLPTRGSAAAAGYDIYACIDENVVIWPHDTEKIGTGLAMAIPDKTYLAIFARSGLATKAGLRPANCTGIVDSDYRGEIIVALHNDGTEPQVIEPGERIAQIVLHSYNEMDFEKTEELDETNRGEGGFGSTGNK